VVRTIFNEKLSNDNFTTVGLTIIYVCRESQHKNEYMRSVHYKGRTINELYDLLKH